MTATATQRREVYILCGAVRLRAVRTVDYAVLALWETITQGGRSRSRFIMCGAVQLSAVGIVSYELFVHSERIRPVTLGVCMYIFFVLNPYTMLSLLKYIINENELFTN